MPRVAHQNFTRPGFTVQEHIGPPPYKHVPDAGADLGNIAGDFVFVGGHGDSKGKPNKPRRSTCEKDVENARRRHLV